MKGVRTTSINFFETLLTKGPSQSHEEPGAARFFLVKRTKMVKYVPNNKWPFQIKWL
jgi:hypothetical protein